MSARLSHRALLADDCHAGPISTAGTLDFANLTLSILMRCWPWIP
jgi:hypothetical protein